MDIKTDKNLIAFCGLYCGACRTYIAGKCAGCRTDKKHDWCKIRKCCIENNRFSCADCADFSDPTACGKFNNWISKVFGFIFNSDRAACIRQLKERGADQYARFMAGAKAMTIRRKH